MISRLTRVAHFVILSTGWQRFVLAWLAGAVGALAMAPVDFLPALAVSLPVAIWLIDGAVQGSGRFSPGSLLAVAGTGWVFGFGYHVAGLWWLGAAFLVETDEFLWLMPLGVLGLPAALAVFHALGFLIAGVLWSSGAARILSLTLGLSISELLRGTVMTGFPWNILGQAFAATDVSAQAASVFGLYGLTVLAVGIFSSPAVMATGETVSARWMAPRIALLVLAGILVFGAVRLSGAVVAMVPGVKIRIVQANVSIRDKITPGAGLETLRRYLTLSDRATSPSTSGIADVTHLVWPESAFPFILSREPRALAQIGAFLPAGTTLITGAVRTEVPLPGSAVTQYFNAIHVVAGGVITDTYDKVHLVPFGEYLPGWIDGTARMLGIRQFVQVPGTFAAGLRHRLLDLRGLPPVLPLICYEAIFPGEATAGLGRPGVLLNVTNDAWFGVTSGPYQHFAQARMRAIELGVPLVRAANSGISAVIDPYGRSVKQTRLSTQDIVDGGLPRALPGTVQSSYGLWVFWATFLLAGLTRSVMALRG